MEINFCKNHKGRLAHYRCYYCKKPICHDCRLTLDHHYFCSRLCFIKYKYFEIAEKLKRKQHTLFVGIQIFLVAFVLFQFLYFQNKLSNLQHSQTPAPADTVFLPAVKSFLNQMNPLFRQLNANLRGEKQKNHYLLNLPLKKGWVINLWKNNQPLFSELTKKDSIYPFNVPLDYGKNRLQILIIDYNQNPIFKDELNIDYRTPFVEAFRHSVEMADTHKKRLAFTFDGGSTATHTEEILLILRENHIRCTMFLTGKFMEKYPDLVKDILKDGHEIGNHTYNHPHLTTYSENKHHHTQEYVDKAFLRKQLLKTDSIFYGISGSHLQPFWRAPFGEYNNRILTWAAEEGYLHIRWTSGFDSFDWVDDQSSKLYRTPQQFFLHFEEENKIRQQGLNGIIVLMHLGSHRDHDHIFEALPEIIRFVQNKGYTLVRISDLLRE